MPFRLALQGIMPPSVTCLSMSAKGQKAAFPWRAEKYRSRTLKIDRPKSTGIVKAGLRLRRR